MRTHLIIFILSALVAGMPLVLHAQGTKAQPTTEAPAAATPATDETPKPAADPAAPPATDETPATGAAATGDDYKFVPLTNLPGIEDASKPDTLPDFLNYLYRLCIGIAAGIAVLQIMRAGAYFMFHKGSVGHNEQAKHLISSSLLGLLLVLSPAIVFGIINPDILKLKLDLSSLSRTLTDIPQTPEQKRGQDAITSLGSGSVTGTTLKKGVFPTKAGLDTFLTQCTAKVMVNEGIATSKGCTTTCTTKGKGDCDADGCSAYTAYCGLTASVALEKTGNTGTYGPRESDKERYLAFQKSCTADGGTWKVRAAANPSLCPGDAVGVALPRCYAGTMRCEP
ncbi:MAG TPA: hypothetical protein VGB97_04010 [Candidatus Paceibacterota bacterium]|jgi:hypothetical protein